MQIKVCDLFVTIIEVIFNENFGDFQSNKFAMLICSHRATSAPNMLLR